VTEPRERERALAVVEQQLRQLFEIEGSITYDTALDDLGLDSLEVVETLVSLQERLLDELGDVDDLVLPTEGVTLARVGDVVDILVGLGWLRSERLAAVLERG
jgi:acyl carrier protein